MIQNTWECLSDCLALPLHEHTFVLSLSKPCTTQSPSLSWYKFNILYLLIVSFYQFEMQRLQ